jgi:hypothetical protein
MVDHMALRNYFKQVFTLDRQITSNRQTLAWLRDCRDSISATTNITGVRSGFTVDKVADNAIRAADLETAIQFDIQSLINVKAACRDMIAMLHNPKYRLILTERYINVKRWEDVASDNYYSWAAVHKMHARAMYELEQTVPAAYLRSILK